MNLIIYPFTPYKGRDRCEHFSKCKDAPEYLLTFRNDDRVTNQPLCRTHADLTINAILCLMAGERRDEPVEEES
jgi:hypothetical protein